MEILEIEEKKITNTLNCLKNPKTELSDRHANKKRDIVHCFKKSEYKYKKYRSLTNIGQKYRFKTRRKTKCVIMFYQDFLYSKMRKYYGIL